MSSLIRERGISGAIVPEEVSGGYEYRLPPGSMLALEADTSKRARVVAEAACRVVRALHVGAAGPDSGIPAAPPWIRRLESHRRRIRHDSTPTGALVRSAIPRDYLDIPIVPSATRPTLLHGAPSLATTYLADGRGLVLTGEDVSTGPPETDWGFLLGELADIALFDSFPVAGHGRDVLAVVDTYTEGLDRGLITSFAQHRQVLHALDYLDSFVTGTDEVPHEIFTILRKIQWDTILR